jgi:predicted RNase H-like HicB family nuclease
MGHPINVTTDRKKPCGSARSGDLQFSIELDREEDGRWIAEIPEVPGALAYGATQHEAVAKAYAIALRAVADDVEQSTDDPPNSIHLVRAIA